MNEKLPLALAQKANTNISKIIEFLEQLPQTLSLDKDQSDIYRKDFEELKKKMR